MNEEMPLESAGENFENTENIKEWFDAEDPKTGLMRRFKNIGEYMDAREQANDRDNN